MENNEAKGHVRIADDVIVSIAGKAALEADGISSVASDGKLKKRGRVPRGGISVRVEGRNVDVDLYVNVCYGCKIQESAADAQLKIKTAVENMTGLNVDGVNIYVVGVDTGKSCEEE